MGGVNRFAKVGIEVKVKAHKRVVGGVESVEPSYYGVLKQEVKPGVWVVLDECLRHRVVLEEWLECKRKPTGRLRGVRGQAPTKRAKGSR